MEQLNPLDALFDRARAHGVTMAAICKIADVDPTTPSRWKRKKNGATVEKLHQLNTALDTILTSRPRPTEDAAA